MPRYLGRETIVIRGTTDGDPEGAIAEANEIEVPFDQLIPKKVTFGETWQDANYTRFGHHQWYYDFFLKLHVADGPVDPNEAFMPDGLYRKLVSILLMKDAYIYRVYKRGNNHAAGFFLWSDENGENFFWYPDDDDDPGIVPYRVRLMGTPSQSPASGGKVTWEMTLTGAQSY